MIRGTALLVGFIACFLHFSSALSAASDEGSSQNLLLKKKLSDEWFLISRSNFATRDHHGEIFIAYTGAGVGYQINDSFSLRFCYRRFWIKLGEQFEAENRPFVESYFTWNHEGFRVTNRTRAEFRLFEYDKTDDVRLRHEVVVEGPWEWTSIGFKSYVEEEIFFSTQNDHIEANWLGCGLSWKPAQGVKMKVGYRWVRQRIGDKWLNRNVIVTGLNYFF